MARDGAFDWTQCFDFLQLGILTAAAYLYYFYLPSHWRASKQDMEQFQWTVTVASNVFVLVAFAFRLTFARSKLEWSLLPRMGTFLFLYCSGHRAVSSSTNVCGVGHWNPLGSGLHPSVGSWRRPGMHLEIATSVGPQGRASGQTMESWGSLWMSVLLPLVILGVASRLIHERPLLATIVVVVTLAYLRIAQPAHASS